MTSQSQQGCSTDIDGIGTQGNGFDDIATGANTAGYHNGSPVPDSFPAQTLIHLCQGQFNGNSHVIPDYLWGSPGSSSNPIDGHDIGTGPYTS
jgi:hypothetical protein